VSKLDDPGGVGAAVLTYFSRDGEVKLTGEKTLAELEDALLVSIDDTISASYCFKIEGAIVPGLLTTVSNDGMVFANRGGAGSGVVIGFWNHASENDILLHGFTFYFLDSDRRGAGVLIDADFGDLTVRIDRIESMDMVFGRGEEIAIMFR
jgi:hypothetical protein